MRKEAGEVIFLGHLFDILSNAFLMLRKREFVFRLYSVEFTLCLLQIKTLSLYFIASNVVREKSVLQIHCDSVVPVLHKCYV